MKKMSVSKGICSECGLEKRLTAEGFIYRHGACKGGGKPDRQYYDDREFGSLVKTQKSEPPEITTLWDGVKMLWAPLHGSEGVLVKGMILVECIDTNGRPNLMWLSSPYMSTWDMKGMVGQVLEDLSADAVADSVFKAIIDAQQASDDEDESDEDIQ
jgi:hypothetical protein